MDQTAGKIWSERLNQIRKSNQVQTIAAGALVVLAPVLVILTVAVAQNAVGSGTPRMLQAILLADLVYLLVIVGLVGWSISRVLIARRAQSAGSRLHLRLTSVFAIVALIPTIIVAVFAVLTITFGVEGWFSKNVRSAIGSSLSAAEAYKEEQRGDLEEDLGVMTFGLNQFRTRNRVVLDADVRDELQRLQGNVQRGLKEAYVIDGSSELRARGSFSYLFDYEVPSEAQLESARNGEVVIIEDWPNNEFRALSVLSAYPDRFLYISRTVDGSILELLDDTAETARTYNDLERQRGQALSLYALIYLGFAIVVILSSIWMGIAFAERLSQPVGRLASAAQRVGAGDFDVQVKEEQGDDEIAMLGRVFNRMTKQVKAQRDDLIDANERTERRRRLFDSVLTGVTAGVIGLSHDGKIGLMNAAAETLLGLDASKAEGKDLSKAVPEFGDMLKAAAEKGVQQDEISLTRAGNAEVLLVRIAARSGADGETEGYVVSFDDVTDLVSAQRMAAWGDVARRIAHEIKNPLTPIQLSTERLRRKFGPKLGDEEQELQQYADVIIRQTNDLRRIVDEFSKFARMPEPQKKFADLGKLIADEVLLQKSAEETITYSFANGVKDATLSIDETMIGQAVVNLLKNAAEAIAKKRETAKKFKAQIKVYLNDHPQGVEVLIQDNGIGLPEKGRSRLFEPYVTQREGGTGLGLSIVKKIIEDHGGTLELADAPPFTKTAKPGAMARIILPKTGAV